MKLLLNILHNVRSKCQQMKLSGSRFKINILSIFVYDVQVHCEVSYLRLLWKPNVGTNTKRGEICSQVINLLRFTLPKNLDAISSSRNPQISVCLKHVLRKRSLCTCPVPYTLPYIPTREKVTLVYLYLCLAVSMLKAVRFPSQELKSRLAKCLSDLGQVELILLQNRSQTRGPLNITLILFPAVLRKWQAKAPASPFPHLGCHQGVTKRSPGC